MRIGIDARELCGHSTGVGRYLGGLLQQWTVDEHARRHEFVLYAHQPLAVSLDAHRFPSRVVPGGGGTRWEQQQLLMDVAQQRSLQAMAHLRDPVLRCHKREHSSYVMHVVIQQLLQEL